MFECMMGRGSERGRTKSKAQAISSDFMLAMILVMIIISTAAASWDRAIYLIGEKNGRIESRRLGMAVCDLLVRSPGVPSDWNSTNVYTLGLVDRQNVLNKNKINEFTSLPKSKIQELLGIRGFDFSLRVRAVNGTVLFDYGNNPTLLQDIIVIRRIAAYEDIPVHVEFGLWRE
jgi:hypothetical protein